ncbi:2-hydroxycarboxylate transporter family protein ['Camptotheca acuminata' phytoplasma]|uniref:2-hydroxycarboxylate transporter family protein n=1 Tax='Camptotheca acuminata' phytoplasma TaxID=3239192 RepID=UPI00351A6B6F
MNKINDKKNIVNTPQNSKKTILGFPKKIIFLISILIAVHIFLSFDVSGKKINYNVWNNLISTLLFGMVLAAILKFVGTEMPILKNIGGGPILCLLIPAFIFNYNFGNQDFSSFQNFFKSTISSFNKNNEKGFGFSDFFVSALIVGSLLNIKKEFLYKIIKKFLPLVIISLTISAIVVGIFGLIFNPIKGIENLDKSSFNPFLDAIFYIFIPIACGGITCGIMPLSKIFSQGNDAYKNLFQDHILPSLLIGGIMSVIIAGLIKKIFGKSKYSSPNKMIEKNIPNVDDNPTANSTPTNNNININHIHTGLIGIFSLFVLSSVFREFISKIFLSIFKNGNIMNYMPPVVIFLVLIIILLKFFDLIPSYYINCIEQAYKFVMNNFTPFILVMLGISTDINKVIESVSNLYFLITCLICVITTALAAAFIGNKFGYYPVQASISAGLCANSIGGAGNIAILEASDSLELMSYAQIATRIGGDIIVVVASILFPLFYHISS